MIASVGFFLRRLSKQGLWAICKYKFFEKNVKKLVCYPKGNGTTGEGNHQWEH
jgi:hypothetical protein